MIRRGLLTAFGSVLASACGAQPAVVEIPQPLAPLLAGDLLGLIPMGGLGWIVRGKPRELAQIAWLIPTLAEVIPEDHFKRFQEGAGFDLRQSSDAVFIARAGGVAQLVRHNGEPGALEAGFVKRLTDEPLRVEDRPDVVRVSGLIGRTSHKFARLGRDVAVYSQGEDDATSTCRLASLFAQGKLAKIARPYDDPAVKALTERFGVVPLYGLAFAPFDASMSDVLGGLLKVVTTAGFAVRPTARENIGISITLAGDFGEQGPEAAEAMGRVLGAIASETMGRLLGLDDLPQAPVWAGDSRFATLHLEVRPLRFIRALKALLERDLSAVMGLP